MKIVDEKGRLFGKLNIIDLLAILLVIAVVGVLGWKLSNHDGASLGGTTKLTYTVKVTGVEPEVYQNIQNNLPGQLMSSGDLLNGHVLSVAATPSVDNNSVKVTDGKLQVTQRQDLVDLVFTVEAYVTNNVTNAVGTQEIRIGNKNIVKTDKFELDDGVILSCSWQAQP